MADVIINIIRLVILHNISLKLQLIIKALAYDMELLKKQLSEKVVFHYQKRLYFEYLTTSRPGKYLLAMMWFLHKDGAPLRGAPSALFRELGFDFKEFRGSATEDQLFRLLVNVQALHKINALHEPIYPDRI